MVHRGARCPLSNARPSPARPALGAAIVASPPSRAACSLRLTARRQVAGAGGGHQDGALLRQDEPSEGPPAGHAAAVGRARGAARVPSARLPSAHPLMRLHAHRAAASCPGLACWPTLFCHSATHGRSSASRLRCRRSRSWRPARAASGHVRCVWPCVVGGRTQAAVCSAVQHANVVATYHYDIVPVASTGQQAVGLKGLTVEDKNQHAILDYKLYLVQVRWCFCFCAAVVAVVLLFFSAGRVLRPKGQGRRRCPVERRAVWVVCASRARICAVRPIRRVCASLCAREARRSSATPACRTRCATSCCTTPRRSCPTSTSCSRCSWTLRAACSTSTRATSSTG